MLLDHDIDVLHVAGLVLVEQMKAL